MDQKLLGENIARYRNKKGLSQEKIAERIGVSRQAVTKWESNISRPSSDNLFKLAEIFGISVDDLLNSETIDNTPNRENYKNSKTPWIFIGITAVCIAAYVSIGVFNACFDLGVFICLFIMGVPIQLFLHIYFSNVIDNDSFSAVAGFDNDIEYNLHEVKKLLTQLDMHIGILSSVHIFLLSVINCFDLGLGRINGPFMALYALNFFATILINDYRAIDKIYIHSEDKKKAFKSIPVTAAYILLLFAGIGSMAFLFELRGIENNTAPAMKLCGSFLLGSAAATAGFFLENRSIKKWNANKSVYKPNKLFIVGFAAAAALYGFMYFI